MLELLRAELGLKGMALLIAFILWISITGEDQAVQDVSLPLEIELREELMLAEPTPTAVSVRLDGPRTLIRNLEPVGLAVRLTLDGGDPGEREIQLTKEHLTGLPRRISVDFFEPPRVKLIVDRRQQRSLPVTPELLGSLPDGYVLYGTRVRPERVVIDGPEAAMQELTELRTDPIRLDGRTRTFAAMVGAVPDTPQISVVDPRPLEVRIVVDEAAVEREFHDILVIASDLGAGHGLEPDRLRVVLRGPPRLLERISSDQIRAVADVAGLEPGSPPTRVDVSTDLVDLPEEQLWRVEVLSIHPSTVSVHSPDEDPSG